MKKPNTGEPTAATLLAAMLFAAERHHAHRRKDSDIPYINHLITVGELLTRVGGVTDMVVLQAAILHDVIEDTQTTRAELTRRFGKRVSSLVNELTENKKMPKEQRKKNQVAHAPELSRGAKQIKIADLTHNITDMPASWRSGKQSGYLTWAQAVVDGCRGANPRLEKAFDKASNGKQRISLSKLTNRLWVAKRPVLLDAKGKMFKRRTSSPENSFTPLEFTFPLPKDHQTPLRMVLPWRGLDLLRVQFSLGKGEGKPAP